MVSAVQHKHEGLEYFMHHANIYAYLVAREALFTNVNKSDGVNCEMRMRTLLWVSTEKPQLHNGTSRKELFGRHKVHVHTNIRSRDS